MSFHRIGIAAALVAGLALPALAAGTSLGTVSLTSRQQLDAPSVDVKSPVGSVQLVAQNADVRCASVVATSSNGYDRTVFTGRLSMNDPKTIDITVPNVTKLTFHCQADGSSASLDVMANA